MDDNEIAMFIMITGIIMLFYQVRMQVKYFIYDVFCIQYSTELSVLYYTVY